MENTKKFISISPKDADSEAKGIQVNKTITLKGSADDKDDFGDI